MPNMKKQKEKYLDKLSSPIINLDLVSDTREVQWYFEQCNPLYCNAPLILRILSLATVLHFKWVTAQIHLTVTAQESESGRRIC